jgi:hypothetical protein
MHPFIHYLRPRESDQCERMLEQRRPPMAQVKFSDWNCQDQKVYESRVQEVTTYYGELERPEQAGLQQGLQQSLQEGLQCGRQEEQVRILIERFLDHENLQKSLLRIEKNYIAKDLVERVWLNHTQTRSIHLDNHFEAFMQILHKSGILK